MRLMADCEFDDMNGVDVLRDFDYASSDFDTYETSEPVGETDADSVWLECNGELVDEALSSASQFATRRGLRDPAVHLPPVPGTARIPPLPLNLHTGAAIAPRHWSQWGRSHR